MERHIIAFRWTQQISTSTVKILSTKSCVSSSRPPVPARCPVPRCASQRRRTTSSPAARWWLCTEAVPQSRTRPGAPNPVGVLARGRGWQPGQCSSSVAPDRSRVVELGRGVEVDDAEMGVGSRRSTACTTCGASSIAANARATPSNHFLTELRRRPRLRAAGRYRTGRRTGAVRRLWMLTLARRTVRDLAPRDRDAVFTLCRCRPIGFRLLTSSRYEDTPSAAARKWSPYAPHHAGMGYFSVSAAASPRWGPRS